MQRIACAAEGGERDISSFLSGANPAGRRQQGAPPPAPLPKGLRPFGIPLSQRIACAAEGEKDMIFVSIRGKIPPGGGGDLLFLVAGLGADSCRGRRRVAPRRRAGVWKEDDARRYPYADSLYVSLAAMPSLRSPISRPPPANPAAVRREFAPGRNACPSFPPRGACNAPHKRDSQGSQTLERGVPRGTGSPLGAAVRRDLPRVETHAHHSHPRDAHAHRAKRDSQGSQTLERGCRGRRPACLSLSQRCGRGGRGGGRNRRRRG